MEMITHGKESRSHVVLHVLVVERHDLYKTLQGSYSHLYVWWLRCFTYYLHDKVSLRLKQK